ncbi:MAG TPA: RloB family protein [Pseudonocardiaceae bacterium]|nr:RloB family protein [Pseudonocardiaceae bacterium]
MSRRQRGSEEHARAGSRSVQHRVVNSVFYVVPEGEGTEYDYFDWLDKDYGRRGDFRIRMPPARVRRNGLSPSRVVDHACHQAHEPDITQIWGLFDHDGRTEIDQICLRQKPDRVRVALSHPSFELWLLLHFQDFTPAAQHGKNELIIDKLRNAHQAFANYGRPNKRIDRPRFAALMEDGGIRNAVHRARRLSRHFTRETPSQRDPSTEVYLLIEALGVVAPPS